MSPRPAYLVCRTQPGVKHEPHTNPHGKFARADNGNPRLHYLVIGLPPPAAALPGWTSVVNDATSLRQEDAIAWCLVLNDERQGYGEWTNSYTVVPANRRVLSRPPKSNPPTGVT